MKRFYAEPTIDVSSTNKKNIKPFPKKFSKFTAEKNPCILYGQVFVIHTVIFLFPQCLRTEEDMRVVVSMTRLNNLKRYQTQTILLLKV